MKEIYIAMIVVVPTEDNDDLGDQVGATVNILYLCKSEKDYLKEVPKLLLKYGYEAIEIEDLEKFNPDNDEICEDLINKSKLLTNSSPLQWGTFYTFDSWDED